MNDRLETLLERWETLAARGVSVSPEDLCPDDPALEAELAKRVSVLQRMGALVRENADLGQRPRVR